HLDKIQVLGGSSEASSFDVYFGTNPTPGPAELRGTTTNMVWDLPLLSPLTTYYWKVVARQTGAMTEGPVWQFMTRGVDHFDWNAISSPQILNQPFSATIVAKDEFNRAVSNFSGTVN